MFGIFGPRIPKTWRKAIGPDCPACGSGGGHTFHRQCRKRGYLWVDIAEGTAHCDGCGDVWSIEKTERYCDCGAKYMGGEIWEGMAAEIGQLGNLKWLTVLGIRKGDLRVRFLGWHTCLFCKRTEGQRGTDRIAFLPRGGLCERCVGWCRDKWNQTVYISPSVDHCLYCRNPKRPFRRMIGNGLINSDAVICGDCIQKAVDDISS